MKTTIAAIFAALIGSSPALADNAPIGPDFVGAAPRLHIDRSLVASSSMNRIEPLDVIAFDHNAADLREETIVQVDAAAKWLRRHTNHRIVLEGHTDQLGTPYYNEDLAMRRMQIVRDRLMRAGIKSDRIIMLTYGEREAIDPENPNDRRVVMFATKLPTQQVVAMQGVHRDVIVATWTERGTLLQLHPGRTPVQRPVISTR